MGVLRSVPGQHEGDRVLGAALWASMNGLYGQRSEEAPDAPSCPLIKEGAVDTRESGHAAADAVWRSAAPLRARAAGGERAAVLGRGQRPAPRVSCPPVKAGYAGAAVSGDIKNGGDGGGVSDVMSRVWPSARGLRARAPLSGSCGTAR